MSGISFTTRWANAWNSRTILEVNAGASRNTPAQHAWVSTDLQVTGHRRAVRYASPSRAVTYLISSGSAGEPFGPNAMGSTLLIKPVMVFETFRIDANSATIQGMNSDASSLIGSSFASDALACSNGREVSNSLAISSANCRYSQPGDRSASDDVETPPPLTVSQQTSMRFFARVVKLAVQRLRGACFGSQMLLRSRANRR